MIRFFKSSLLVIMLFAVFSATAYADKVTVCHVPPSNPANFHDITISENALQAHLNHGDFMGSCFENCAALCDDDDACTQDYVADNGECVCLDQHPPVDCDDSNPCTADSCDTLNGCEYDMTVMNGTTCDDGDPQTTNDVCTDGVCAGSSDPQLDCPCMIQIPDFAAFVESVDSDMICNYSADTWEISIDAWPIYVYVEGGDNDPVCGYVNFGVWEREITQDQANDCRSILLEAAEEANLDCD